MLKVTAPANLESLLKKSAPENFKPKRIAKDAREVEEILAVVTGLNPFRHGDLDELHDLGVLLSYTLHPYGLDLSLNVSLAVGKRAPSDPWGIERDLQDAANDRAVRRRSQKAKAAAANMAESS